MHPPTFFAYIPVCIYEHLSHTPHKGQSAPVWKEDSDFKENVFYIPLETTAFSTDV